MISRPDLKDISPQPVIAMNNSGNFIITWQGQDNDSCGIYAQRFLANETSVSNAFLVNTYQNNTQANPSIAYHNDDSFIIVWESYEQEGQGLDFGIYGQRFNNFGQKIGNEFSVNSY